MHRKLALDLNDLAVESFRTAGEEAGVPADGPLLSIYRQTVLRETEWYSCGGTCGTCGGTDCWA